MSCSDRVVGNFISNRNKKNIEVSLPQIREYIPENETVSLTVKWNFSLIILKSYERQGNEFLDFTELWCISMKNISFMLWLNKYKAFLNSSLRQNEQHKSVGIPKQHLSGGRVWSWYDKVSWLWKLNDPWWSPSCRIVVLELETKVISYTRNITFLLQICQLLGMWCRHTRHHMLWNFGKLLQHPGNFWININMIWQ